MIDRDKHIAQKKKEIQKIEKRQFTLIMKAANIAGAPYKRPATFTKRMIKVVAITMHVRALEMQKQMIMAQPVPTFVPGGIIPDAVEIVGESGL